VFTLVLHFSLHAGLAWDPAKTWEDAPSHFVKVAGSLRQVEKASAPIASLDATTAELGEVPATAAKILLTIESAH